MARRGMRAGIITTFLAVAALLCGVGYAVAQVTRAPATTSASSAISSAQSASGSSYGSNTVSVSLPSSATAGDLLVAEVTTRGGSTTITAPSGWAQAGPRPCHRSISALLQHT